MMNVVSRVALLGVVTCAGQAAMAARTADGVVSLGGFENENLSTAYLFGDFSLTYQNGAWGGEIGMFGVVGRLHETYASVTWSTDTSKVEFGFPRPAYDRYAISALTRLAPRLALETIGTSRSRATFGTMFEPEFLPYGAVYSLASGANSASVSLHGVPDTDVVILGAGGQIISGALRLDAGVEAVSQNDAIAWNVKAQIARDMGRWDLGLGVYAADANGAPDVAEVFASVEATQNVRLTTLLRETRGADTAFGFGVTYDTGHSLTTDVAVISEGSNQTGVAVSLGYAF